MEFVEPIRDKQKITEIKNLLTRAAQYRDLLLFIVGINTAFRISDLLQLQIVNFVDAQGNIRGKLSIQGTQPDQQYQIVIHSNIRLALETYFVAYPTAAADPNHFIFFSSKRDKPNYLKPITRVHAWRVISGACKAVGLVGNYGTHSLRKTWGYHARQHGVPLELIMTRLNHANIVATKRYLGITDEELRTLAEEFSL